MTEFFHSSAFTWDKMLFQCINSHHSPLLDRVMWVITNNWSGLLFFLILSATAVWHYRKKSWKILLLIAVFTLSGDAIGARVLKTSLCRLRPSHDSDYHGDYQVHLLQKRDGTYYRGGKYSCPSNHAINYMTMSLLFFYFLRPKVRRRWLLAVFIFGVTLSSCYSRVYAGVHYPFDIFSGWLVAVFLAGVAIMIFRSFAARSPNTVSRTSSVSKE